MAAPSGVTPYTKGVIIELNSLTITPQQNTSVFGTVVLKGATVTLYDVDDVVLMDNFSMFSQGETTYAISDEADVLLVYLPV